MKYRIAKKILFGDHWQKRWKAMRPMYYDQERGHWVQPSMHDIPNPKFQKARTRFFGYWKKKGEQSKNL